MILLEVTVTMNEKSADSDAIKVTRTPLQPVNSYGSFLVKLTHTGNKNICLILYALLE